MAAPTLEDCAREIAGLHRFFTDWFHGVLPDTDDAWARVAGVLAPTFQLITPDGHALERDVLLAGIRERHGSHGPTRDFEIATRNVTGRYADDHVVLVTYEEWQRRDGADAGRLSTALFECAPATPHGVRWRHVHETWLPVAN